MSATPMEVISSIVKKEKSFRVVTARECALGLLKDLGKVQRSFGALSHWILYYSGQLLPNFLFEKIIQSEGRRVLSDYGKK